MQVHLKNMCQGVHLIVPNQSKYWSALLQEKGPAHGVPVK